MSTIVSLIGEQNLPNLLPIRYLQPERVILVYTEYTEETATRLTHLIQDDVEVIPLVVDAYDIEQTKSCILAVTRPYLSSEVKVNFTGGTKMMSLAAYQAAIEIQSPIFYLRSQYKKTVLYAYSPENGRYLLQETKKIPSLITIEDYLKVYLDDYKIVGIVNSSERGRQFENAVYQALEPAMDEICAGVKMHNTIDIDFVIRCGNLVGIIETKTGLNKPKRGIDQLNTAGGRDYLGIYTQKFFVGDQVWGENLDDLKQIAQERKIQIIELPSFGENTMLSEEDANKLQSQIKIALGCQERTPEHATRA